jgi:hypothetical protein
MLSCGSSATAERPCWFPDEAAIFLVDTEGATRRVVLAGLAVVSPETLLTSENPARPVRDVYVNRDGDIWVLSSGTPPAGPVGPAGSVVPGGWVLARYGAGGESKGVSRLREAARLILAVDTRRVTLLLSSGHVGEIESW